MVLSRVFTMAAGGGGCWRALVRCLSNRGDEPQRTRYRTEAVESIKFENLLTVERREKETRVPLVSDVEASHVREGRIDQLEEALRREDNERDAQLRLQEEALKREEEAYYAAKREAARKSRQLLPSAAAPRRTGGGLQLQSGQIQKPREQHQEEIEEDFDKFLENIKAKQTAMTSQTRVAITSDSEEEEVDFGYWEKAASGDGVRGGGGNLREVDLDLL